jgi:hypothetical protein
MASFGALSASRSGAGYLGVCNLQNDMKQLLISLSDIKGNPPFFHWPQK